jgi:hypothetical protein
MKAAEWHESMVGAQNRLFRLGKARVAREKAQPLFCWYGPRVPEYVVVAGRGPYRGIGGQESDLSSSPARVRLSGTLGAVQFHLSPNIWGHLQDLQRAAAGGSRHEARSPRWP